MDLETWELLSYVVTVIGLPLAIGVFIFERRQEHESEEEAIWQQLSDAYIDFLEVVLANPDLRLLFGLVRLPIEPSSRWLGLRSLHQ